MDLWQLDTLVRRYRTQARERFRRNRGFTEREVKKLQAKFQQYQPDSEDALEKRHLADLIADLFPDSGRDAATHHKAAQILHEVDQDGDGKLEFDEYLQLMRLIQDAADLQKIEKEQTAVQATGFLREEVAEFRKVFQVFDSDASGEMSFDEFISLIATLVPDQDTNMSRELQNMLKDIDKDGNRSLDFPEFLRIMRRVQDDNWGEVNQRAAEKVAENEAIDAGVTSTTAQVPNRAEDAPEMQALEKDEDEAEQEEEDDLVVELEHLMIEPLRRYAKIYGASKAEMIEAESVKKARGHYVELIISKRRHLKKLSVEQLRDRAQMLGITPDELDKAADVINEHAALRKLVMETIRSRIHDSDEDDKDNVAS
jgi:Ca2+-binding EF-hand superfamily protein